VQSLFYRLSWRLPSPEILKVSSESKGPISWLITFDTVLCSFLTSATVYYSAVGTEMAGRLGVGNSKRSTQLPKGIIGRIEKA
jgi:hypothetical protein